MARAVSGALTPSLTFTTLKLLGLLFSLGTLALLVALVRRFFPERPGRQALVLALVLATPRFLLSGVMMGNDAAVLFFATLTLLVAARCAEREDDWAWTATAGVAAGAAVLAKYNALALVPVVGAAAIWPWWRRRSPGRRAALRLAVAAAAFLLVTGPWFVRNVVETGTPLPSRMDRVTDIETDRYCLYDLRPVALLETPFALAERVQPGETLPYRDHQVLTAADTSLWTKTYALWWADALYYLAQPPAWTTAARYVAAFPVCLVALFGALFGLRALLSRKRRLAPAAASWVAPLALVPVLLFLYFAFVARYPWVRMGHGRASFLLPLVAPFALCWGLGVDALTERWPGPSMRRLLLSSLAVLVALGVAYTGFLIATYF